MKERVLSLTLTSAGRSNSLQESSVLRIGYSPFRTVSYSSCAAPCPPSASTRPLANSRYQPKPIHGREQIDPRPADNGKSGMGGGGPVHWRGPFRNSLDDEQAFCYVPVIPTMKLATSNTVPKMKDFTQEDGAGRDFPSREAIFWMQEAFQNGKKQLWKM